MMIDNQGEGFFQSVKGGERERRPCLGFTGRFLCEGKAPTDELVNRGAGRMLDQDLWVITSPARCPANWPKPEPSFALLQAFLLRGSAPPIFKAPLTNAWASYPCG
jgi:hypothetical protein